MTRCFPVITYDDFPDYTRSTVNMVKNTSDGRIEGVLSLCFTGGYGSKSVIEIESLKRWHIPLLIASLIDIESVLS